MKKFRYTGSLFLTMLAAIVIFMGTSLTTYAADGNLSIAVSSANVSVGNEVTVTLTASGSGGEKATADMVFSYNAGVFSFVSCNAEGYSGGGGGQVSFRGSSVKVVLKAVDNGSSNLKVTGSNGTISESGEALGSMVSAGTTIKAGQDAVSENKSGDNSLSSLSLSAGELTPGFAYNVTSYTATVPYETESVEVAAQPSNGKAKVVDISGNSQLQVGENTIQITVEAENGAKAVYSIVLTREEAVEEPIQVQPGGEEIADPDTEIQEPESANPDAAAQLEEYEQQLSSLKEQYDKLNVRYKAEKSSHRMTMAILIFIIIVLIIVCVNIFLFAGGRRKKHDEDPMEGEEDWLDEDEDEDYEASVFSSNSIPAPDRTSDKEKNGFDFIDLDKF